MLGFSYHNELSDDLRKKEGKKIAVLENRFKIRTWITLFSETVFFSCDFRSSKCNFD